MSEKASLPRTKMAVAPYSEVSLHIKKLLEVCTLTFTEGGGGGGGGGLDPE